MYHLHARYIAKSSGGSLEQSVQYIARLGRFKNRGDAVRDVVNLHMPAWAAGDAMAYWHMADSAASRANARGGCRIEFALPRALPKGAQQTLVMGFAQELSRLTADGRTAHGKLPMTLAIHEGYGRNPHVHLLMSSSINDGIARTPAHWFRRFNSVHPEHGGAQRSRIMCKTPWLLQVRSAWARLANQALIAAGFAPVMTHTSLAARGHPAVSAVHLGPSTAYSLRQGKPTQRGQRYHSANQRNQAIVELQDSIEKSRKRLAALQVTKDLEAQAYERWQVLDAQACERAFQDHPLAGNEDFIQKNATLIVRQTSCLLNAGFCHLTNSQAFEAQLLARLAPSWQGIRTTAGLWLIRPDVDAVVRVTAQFIATDARDMASLKAVYFAATLQPWQDRTIYVHRTFRGSLPRKFCALGKILTKGSADLVHGRT